MTRNSTHIKEQKVLREFHRLLRSGKDWEVLSMYKEAGNVGFISWKSAQRIIRKHYKKIITDEMNDFIEALDDTPHEVKVELFSKRFDVCMRESRLIIRYIKRNSIVEKLK